MRIRIINNQPTNPSMKSIEHILGKEFDVKQKDDDGTVYIEGWGNGLGDSPLYAICNGEYEVIEHE